MKKTASNRRLLGVLLAVIVVVSACSDGSEGGDDAAEASDAPDTTSAADTTAAVETASAVFDWEVQTPEAQGMDPARLDEARQYAFEEGRHTQGVVVVHNGVIVAEWYDEGADEDSWATSYSVAKSVTGALIGIAIDEGLIPSIDEPMTTYYPDWEGTPREEITIRHVLQMASGLDFSELPEVSECTAEALAGDRDFEDCRDEVDDLGQMVWLQPDQLAFAADRPLLHPPGTEFNYSSGDTQLLSGVIEQATGMNAGDYAEEKLFNPIGIEQTEWWVDAAGHTLTYGFLETTTRDFARFGLLYLNGGAWGEQQVVPEQWVADSVDPSLSWEWYGYQWWLDVPLHDQRLPADTFTAQGLGGQFIYVVPSLDLVVVRNSTHIKHDGEPVADPNLVDALVPNLATIEESEGTGWNSGEFLLPIIDSIEGVEVDESVCPNDWGGSCLGPLEAATYATTEFQPAFTYTVPNGWENFDDRSSNFALFTEIEVPGIIGLILDPVALLPEPAGEQPEIDHGVGSSVEELVSWLTDHPELETTDPEPFTIGGFDGVQLDVSIAPTSTSSPGWCDEGVVCVDVLGQDPPEAELALYGMEDRIRAILLITSDGDTLLIFVDEFDNTPEAFQGFADHAQPVLDSFDFTG